MIWALALACGIASVPAGLRSMRIAQREHYLAPSVTRFAARWWTSERVNLSLLAIGLIGVVGTSWSVWFGFMVAVAQVGPLGLPVRGGSPSLSWTPRLRRLAVTTAALLAALYVAGGVTKTPLIIVCGLLALPSLVDIALVVLGPLERVLGSRWVKKAARKLEAVGAEVVAITGSYGKTTTKNYAAHLLAGSRRVVASPASFNNRMGLARAINENLTPGAQVFLAEMGTYRAGEIRDLCRWIPPKVAAIVAIGPVHLERFRTLERIVAAKSEILERAEVGVICVDNPLLGDLAAERGRSMDIIEVSTTGGELRIGGEVVHDVPNDVFGANLVVALGICKALGVDPSEVLERVADLPVVDHRQSVSTAEAGFFIIDNTFNSNPAGARSALEVLRRTGSGKLVVVTPGMVELGPVQHAENAEFAGAASALADHLLIVGRTNRKALLEGSAGGRASVTVVASRDDAVTWVREHLGPGDAVLYENDLPDHYP